MKQVSKTDHLKEIVLEAAPRNFAEWCISNGYEPDEESKGYYNYCKQQLSEEIVRKLIKHVEK